MVANKHCSEGNGFVPEDVMPLRPKCFIPPERYLHRSTPLEWPDEGPEAWGMTNHPTCKKDV